MSSTVPRRFEDIRLTVVSVLWGRSAGPVHTGWSPEGQTDSQRPPPSPNTAHQSLSYTFPHRFKKKLGLSLLPISYEQTFTSVSCSRWPIKDKDSPSSCRWAAASMGSTSGTRAGDRDMVPGVLVGDTTPAAVPTTVSTQQFNKAQCEEKTKLRKLVLRPPGTTKTPLLLPSLAVLCFIVVASALFCLCCRYWAFCLHTWKDKHV